MSPRVLPSRTMRSAVIMMSLIRSWPGCSPCIAISSATFFSRSWMDGAGSVSFTSAGRKTLLRSAVRRLAGGCLSKNVSGGGGGVGATGSGFIGNETAPGSCGNPCSAAVGVTGNWPGKDGAGKPRMSCSRRVVFRLGVEFGESAIRRNLFNNLHCYFRSGATVSFLMSFSSTGRARRLSFAAGMAVGIVSNSTTSAVTVGRAL